MLSYGNEATPTVATHLSSKIKMADAHMHHIIQLDVERKYGSSSQNSEDVRAQHEC